MTNRPIIKYYIYIHVYYIYIQIQTYNGRCRFFTGVNIFWVVQNNKLVIDAMDGLYKRRKATSISTFDFSTLYTKLPHNKLLMVYILIWKRK